MIYGNLGGGSDSPLTTKGDVYTYDSADARLPVGANGTLLQADSAETTGLKWASVAGTGDVTAAAVLTDNSIVRGDGGAKGVQDSGLLIDDTDNLSGVASLDIAVGGDVQINSVSVLNATTLGSAVVSSSLTSVGTIATGVWNGTTIAVADGGTGATTLGDGFVLLGSGTGAITALDVTAKGSLLAGDGTTDPVALAVGTNDFVLTADSAQPSGLKWAAGGSSSPLTTKGDIYTYSTVDARLGVGTNDFVLTADSAEATGLKWAAVAAGMPEFVAGGTAASHQVNTTTAVAPLSYRDFGSIEIITRAFDDTGPEYMQGFFRVPEDLGAGASNVTFEIIGSAATAAASKNVKFTFDFVEVADSGLMTGAYGSAEVWDDQSISATQDDQDIISNTETITNLGWTAGNMIYYRLYRSAATTTNLSGDYNVISFYIRIPRA